MVAAATARLQGAPSATQDVHSGSDSNPPMDDGAGEEADEEDGSKVAPVTLPVACVGGPNLSPLAPRPDEPPTPALTLPAASAQPAPVVPLPAAWLLPSLASATLQLPEGRHAGCTLPSPGLDIPTTAPRTASNPLLLTGEEPPLAGAAGAAQAGEAQLPQATAPASPPVHGAASRTRGTRSPGSPSSGDDVVVVLASGVGGLPTSADDVLSDDDDDDCTGGAIDGAGPSACDWRRLCPGEVGRRIVQTELQREACDLHCCWT